MAACAGALGLRLEKPGGYVLLDEGEEPRTRDVPRAIGLIQRAIFLILAAALLILYSA